MFIVWSSLVRFAEHMVYDFIFFNRCNRFESKQKLVKAKCLQINREGNILDGLSVKLCFESGVLPNWVMVGYVSYPVKAYVCAPL